MANMVLGKNFLIYLFLLVVTARIYGQEQRMSKELFPVDKEPSSTEWQQFLEMNESMRKELWNFHLRKGRQLKDWSWQWRIAWIRVCATSHEEYCSRIMTQGLADPALVVRAEAASRIGDRFHGTKGRYPIAIQVLVQAYQLAENNRHGEPMFVKYRILEALDKIGGQDAKNEGQKLAASHPKTKHYWQKISSL